MPERKYTEAQKQSAKKWDAANLDRLSLALPKGDKERIKAHAVERGESVNGFIKRAIDEAMERDKSPAAPGSPAEAVTGVGSILAPESLQAAQAAAQAAGEEVPVFLSRAIEAQAKRDKVTHAFNLNVAETDEE